ncbi:hypothetical protein HYX06_06225 [Candidatus Woesearchaeota archaeon]|nr:hypothetical protein [Candidatus Woesearchaeota archaeon]
MDEGKGLHAHIRCRTIIEVLGKPKEHVEKSLNEYVQHIKEDPELVVLNEEYSEAKEIEKHAAGHSEEKEQTKASSRMASDEVVTEKDLQKDKKPANLWSQFVELDLVVKGTQKLISFCFEYMPSSIEVAKPESLAMTSREISSFLNDLQARLHNVDMVVKQLKAENDFLRLNMNAIIHNAILICLKVSKLSLEQLSQVTGLDKKELEIFVGKLIKDSKIKKENELYCLA